MEVEVVKLILICLGTGALSLLFQKCMEEGMIFRRYYLLLTSCWIKWYRRKDRWKRNLLKPIGLCIYCYSTWLAIFSFLYYYGVKLEVFLFIGMNYILIEFLLYLKRKYIPLQ